MRARIECWRKLPWKLYVGQGDLLEQCVSVETCHNLPS